MFKRDNFITLEESTHTYTDIEGVKYTSLSHVLNTVKIPFDRMGRSIKMANGDKVKQAEILKGWDATGDNARSHGNRIHNALEDYFNAKPIVDNALLQLAKLFSAELKGYDKIFPEAILYSKEHLIAGTTDLLLQRQRKTGFIDFFDYKTNLEKGIYFDSISRKKGVFEYWNKKLLHPLEHLEECNYNIYALQLSGYAYMAEITYGLTPGKLFIVYIYMTETGYDYRMIPVPYMKYEIKALFDSFINLKKI